MKISIDRDLLVRAINGLRNGIVHEKIADKIEDEVTKAIRKQEGNFQPRKCPCCGGFMVEDKQCHDCGYGILST